MCLVKNVNNKNKNNNSVIKLRSVAERLEARANESLSRDRQANTARRASMAASADQTAFNQLAMAKTMIALADAIEGGDVVNLNGLKATTHLETLDYVLVRAKRSSGKAKGERWDFVRDREPELKDVDYAKYPYPYVNIDVINRLMEYRDTLKGMQKYVNQFKNLIISLKPENDHIDVTEPEQIENLKTLISKLELSSSIDLQCYGRRLAGDLEHYKRVQSMGLRNETELRAALGEYLQFKNPVSKRDNIKELERGLIGCKISGYFPTPVNVVNKLLQKASIEPGMKILEPSAGKGNITEQIKLQHPNTQIFVIEKNHTLRNILQAKGYNLIGEDFLQYQEEQIYDRIIMNPPFEEQQDIDHVKKAFDVLKPGGRLAAIMSESPFFNSNKKSSDFRDWLENVGGTSEKLPEGAFKNSERSTNVSTRIVVIVKSN